MVNVDKIKRLAELQGIKLTRVCETIGRKVYYLNDVKRCGGNMPQEYIEKIAALLSTTPEYLCDETDDPEIPLIRARDQYASSELDEYLEELKTRPEMKMLFSLAKDATPEEVEQAVAIIEALRKTKNG